MPTAKIRPLARQTASCTLPDGRVFVVTGEDYSKSYGAPITRGATYTFDPATATFDAHPPAPDRDGRDPEHAVVLPSGRVLVVLQSWDGDPAALIWDPDRAKWHKAPTPPGRVVPGSVLVPIEGGAVLLGGGRSTQRFRDGAWEAGADLAVGREYDTAARTADGSWIVGGGDLDEDLPTAPTVHIAPDGTIGSGPDLPDPGSTRGPILIRSDGAVVVVDIERLHVAGGPPIAAPELQFCGCHVQTGDVLWSIRQIDAVVVRTDLSGGGSEIALRASLPHASARPHRLADGRVLLVGGEAFGNNECEPELFDPSVPALSALAGQQSLVNRLAKRFAKWSEKNR